MSALSAAHTPLGKTCAEIASLARVLGASQTDARLLGSLKAQLDQQMVHLETHLAAVNAESPAKPAVT